MVLLVMLQVSGNDVALTHAQRPLLGGTWGQLWLHIRRFLFLFLFQLLEPLCQRGPPGCAYETICPPQAAALPMLAMCGWTPQSRVVGIHAARSCLQQLVLKQRRGHVPQLQSRMCIMQSQGTDASRKESVECADSICPEAAISLKQNLCRRKFAAAQQVPYSEAGLLQLEVREATIVQQITRQRGL
jgi:hypothetical protein